MEIWSFGLVIAMGGTAGQWRDQQIDYPAMGASFYQGLGCDKELAAAVRSTSGGREKGHWLLVLDRCRSGLTAS